MSEKSCLEYIGVKVSINSVPLGRHGWEVWETVTSNKILLTVAKLSHLIWLLQCNYRKLQHTWDENTCLIHIYQGPVDARHWARCWGCYGELDIVCVFPWSLSVMCCGKKGNRQIPTNYFHHSFFPGHARIQP